MFIVDVEMNNKENYFFYFMVRMCFYKMEFRIVKVWCLEFLYSSFFYM